MKNALLLGLALMFGTVNAMADCDEDRPIVEDWTYSYVVARPLKDAPFPQCEFEAEQTMCVGKKINFEECGAEMQDIYNLCVARNVCAQWVTDGIHSGLMSDLDDFEGHYQRCVDLVIAMGGDY